MKKRILSLLLALCMIAALLPVTALAEDAATDKPSVTFNYLMSSTTKSIVVDAGDDPLYWVTTNSNTNKPDYYYMEPCEATDEWNVKLEYPIDGIPTATLRNATFVETDSWILQFCGSGNYTATQTAFDGDVKVILEGTNTASFESTRPAIRFNTTGTATIAGPGSLTISHSLSSNTYGVIHSAGNLVFDNATVDITIPTVQGRTGIGMAVRGGDLTVKGGHLKLDGHNEYPSGTTDDSGNSIKWSNLRPISYALWVTQAADGTAGGNVFIQDHANVEIFGSSSNSTVNSTTVAETIRLEGKLSISESDALFAATSGSYIKAFAANAPTVELDFDKGYTVAYSSYGNSTNAKCSYNTETKLPNAPSDTATTSNITDVTMNGLSYFKVTHICVPADEPVYENASEGVCSTQKYEVYKCTICGKQVGDKTVVTVPNENAHTPGTANIVSQENATSTNNYVGYYVTETYCDVCGEFIKTENVSFAAGLFHMITSGYTGYAAPTTPNIVLNPGETKYYITVQNASTSDYPDGAYRAAGSADNWNIKLEYPVGGHPIMTLKDAKIKNNTGIFYGTSTYNCGAPLKIVVQEDSVVATRLPGETIGAYSTIYGALNFYTAEEVTITGPGKLLLGGADYNNTDAIVLSMGDITFDSANVEIITDDETTYSTNGIYTTCGDIAIKSSTLHIEGVDNKIGNSSANAFISIIRAKAVDDKGGNIVIEGGSKVSIVASAWCVTAQGLNCAVQADKAFTIKDSEVEFALVSSENRTSLFNATNKPVLDFTKEYTVTASTSRPAYDAETGEFTVPTATVDFATHAGTNLYYFKVGFTPVAFAGTQVVMESSLDLNFAISKNVSDTTGYVEFVREYADGSTKTTKVSLADCLVEGNDTVYVMTYHDIAAKEMGDKVHVTVRTAGGAALTETYTDSIETYALRMLRKDLYADDTVAYNLILKNLLVDMLYYGAAAQVNFSYDVEDPVTAELTEAEKDYHTSAMKECTTEQTVSDPALYQGTQFVLESKLSMNMAVSTDAVSAKVSYTDHMGNEITNKDAILNEELTAEANGSANVFVFNDMVAADGECVITWNFYNENDELILTVTDGLAIYVTRMKDSYPWLETIAIYSNSAYAFLHQQSV